MHASQQRINIVRIRRMPGSPVVLPAVQFVRNALAVYVTRRPIVVDRAGQDARVRFDTLAIDRFQYGDACLLARLPLAVRRDRIRYQTGPRYKRHLLPVDPASLRRRDWQKGGGGVDGLGVFYCVCGAAQLRIED